MTLGRTMSALAIGYLGIVGITDSAAGMLERAMLIAPFAMCHAIGLETATAFVVWHLI